MRGKKFYFFMGYILFSAAFWACNKNKQVTVDQSSSQTASPNDSPVEDSAEPNITSEEPEIVKTEWTAKRLKKVATILSNRMTYRLPQDLTPSVNESSILDAGTDKIKAKQAYDKVVEGILNSPMLTKRMYDYWRPTLRAGAPFSRDNLYQEWINIGTTRVIRSDPPLLEENREEPAVELAAFGVTNDKPIDYIFTTDDTVIASKLYEKYDDSMFFDGEIFNKNPPTGSKGYTNKSNQTKDAPVGKRAGVFTHESVVRRGMANGFGFRQVRDITMVTLCSNYPKPHAGRKSWDRETIAVKYRESGGIKCDSCHAYMNPARGAWLKYDSFGTYRDIVGGAYPFGEKEMFNVFGLEGEKVPGQAVPIEVHEPLNQGNVIASPNDRLKLFEFMEGAGPVLDPHTLLEQITTHPLIADEYNRCMLRRAMSVVMAFEEGKVGVNPQVMPYEFKANASEKAMFEKWLVKFKASGRKWKSFWIEFVKSPEFINSIPDEGE